jgi:hypothetical protein
VSGLPDRPDLDQLRRQARELLRAAASGEPLAVGRLGAVSPRLTLSAAQLALAREYGFQSWAALKTEVARRRSPALPEDRWSFGADAALQTPVGVLLPEILMAGASQAILHGSLTLSDSVLAAAVPRRRVPAPGALLNRLVHRRTVRQVAGQRRRTTWHIAIPRDRRAEARAAAVSAALRALRTSVTIVDDRGAQYPTRGWGLSGKAGAPDGYRVVYLRVDPVPGREVGWIGLRGQDGATARLLRSPRAAARVGQLRPARVTEAGWSGMPGQAPRADGPRLCRDVGVALPALDGVSIQLDSLISLPASWHLYLRATPRWRNYNQAGQSEREVSVHAADDRGGSYQGSYAGNTKVVTAYATEEEYAAEWAREPEELALQFLPRLDPLARALKLTFQGAGEEITVALEIGERD